MNSLIRPIGMATALCGVVLAGCNAVTTAPEKNYTALPAPTVVLQGTIQGLGSKRSVTLENNGDSAGALGFIAADPALPTAGPPPVPFSFGAVPQGSAYNITVKANPFGKICTVANGAGTITTADDLATHPITVTCANDPAVARYDLTVNLPNDPTAFTGLAGATVNVKTEDQIYSKTVTPGQTSVVFPGVLFNGTGQLNAFTWTVNAIFKEADGTADRCVVTGPTGTNPTGNVATPRVGTSATQTVSACKFTISGSVAYNVPPGGAAAPSMPAGGLTLDVRDTQGNVVASQDVTAYGAFTVGGATPVLFPSNSSSVYDIVVSRQPTGQTCIVGDGGGVNFYVGTTTNNPVSVTSTGSGNPPPPATATSLILGSRLNVFCRATPSVAKQLKGVFRLTSVTWTPNINAVPTAPITSTWTPYDLSVQNTASSNMLTFFDDGTFLYGTHAVSTQVEHGFYDYDATAQTLRFTLVTDTNTGVTFPGTFSPAQSGVFTVGSSLLTTTNGLSATPGKIATATIPSTGAGSPTGPGSTTPGVLNAAMTGVQLGTTTVAVSDTASQTVRTLSGTFGGDSQQTVSTVINPDAVNGTTHYPSSTQRLAWVLTEPKSIDHEMTGAWTTQDHRRFWVWDYSTYYGTQVGVTGGAASMNDACFTTEDLHASSGIYTRRGTITQCIAFGRLSSTQSTNGGYAFVGTLESVDYNTASISTPPSGFSVLFSPVATLPGFVGRMPGGQSAADGRSPSPIHYYIAPAASFDGDTTYFPAPTVPFTSWCSTEILGVRATSNDIPINQPVYFCRTRAP